MTRDEVIRLALKAGFTWEPINNIADPLERFAALVIGAKDGPWKAAVIDQLVIAHILTAEHETDPGKALRDLLAFESDIAIDPRVSGAAAELVEQSRAEEREACAKACEELFPPPGEQMAVEWAAGTIACANAIRARGHK